LLLNEEEIQLLTKIGLTKTQAKIYLTLLKNGNVRARTLAEIANSPRPLVYRSLDELQKMGLVEKQINTPHKFVATPPEHALQILMQNKFQRLEKLQDETNYFLRKFEKNQTRLPLKRNPEFKIVDGRRRILQIIKTQHKMAQQRIHIITTFQRFYSALNCCFEECDKALQNGVEYRIVIGKNEGNTVSTENLQLLQAYPNFRLKLSCTTLINNLAIFDGKEATFNFIPSKSFNESPIIWTNHQSFIRMAEDHFNRVWKSADKHALKGASIFQ